MVFDLEAWKQAASDRLRQIGAWLDRRRREDAPYVVYGAVCGATIWPLIEAAQQGQLLPVVMALGGVAGGIGGNLIAEQIQRWKDRADKVSEEEVAQWVAAQADDPNLRAALDAILEELEAVTLAQASLSESDRRWFADTLRGELDRLGNRPRFEAMLIGSGAVAHGEGAMAAGERGVAAQQAGLINTGDGNIFVLDAAFFKHVVGQTAPPVDLQQATQHYLQYLVDRYRYLDFRGMGVADRVPLRLALKDMYVPLKARIALPGGETWTRAVRVAGRGLPDDERENMGDSLSGRTPLVKFLTRHNGLIILGDPGAGKTTFLKFLTLQLATGAASETRLPVLVPLSAYANALAGRDVRLDDFIAGYFHNLGADLPIEAMLRQALSTGGAVVMLDGLDEVKDLHLRDTVVRRVIDFYTFHHRAGNKFLLTSRIIGYRDVRPTAEGLAECTLVDFDEEDVDEFVERWTAAVEKAASGDTTVAALEAARERRELLDAVNRNPGVRRLAANPLLLTILALMKRQGVTLPERRVELYQKYVETLLSTWNRARGLDRPPVRDLDVVETIRILAPLALWMHQVSPGVGLVRQHELLDRLDAIYRERGEAHPERAAQQFLFDVREHAGLLLERGPGQYGFIHLTFEEYLAAVALAGQGQQGVEPVVTALVDHIGDPAWREVSLLTVGYLGIVQQRDKAASAVVEGLLKSRAGQPGEIVVLACDAVADAWPGGVTAVTKDKCARALLAAMRDDARVKPPMRASAGNTLARLGDPRPEVMTLDAMPFCYVPPGAFIMGEGNEEHVNEHPDYGYWIGRYPVTNAQFNQFVEAGGYREADYWSEAKTHGWWSAGQFKGRIDSAPRDRPNDYGEPFNLSNHPVVGVTWYEALAFTRWLTGKWRGEKRLTPRWEVRLPSEAEWEKAARGGIDIPAQLTTRSDRWDLDPPVLVKNPASRRGHPWGDQPDPSRANYRDTGIGATSAAGCFPAGSTPYRCEDMSGNVWEWTRSIDKEYPYNPKDGRESLSAGSGILRVLRGGSFNSAARYVRCASRIRAYPDPGDTYGGFRVVLSPL